MTGTAIAIGIDIGGGSTKLGLVTQDGTILARRHLSYGEGASADAIVASYVRAAEAMLTLAPGTRLCGIGIGFPGHVAPDHASGTNGNVRALNGQPIAAQLAARFGCPVRLINDADAGAVAEYHFGAGRGAERLLLITLGTGIGVGFAVGGVPVATANGCLGDAGHMILVQADPVRCRQGCLGCLESVASGAAIAAQARARRPLTAESSAIAALIRDALTGDPAATRIITAAGRWIGMAAASWCNLFAPGMVLIGGGLSVLGAGLIDPIRDEALARAMPCNVARTVFAPAGLGNDAGIIGAAAGTLFPGGADPRRRQTHRRP